MEINQVQEINSKNILEILSITRTKLIEGKDMLVFSFRLNDNPVQIKADMIDNKKKRTRLLFFNGKKTNVIIGKSIIRIKFSITYLKKQLSSSFLYLF